MKKENYNNYLQWEISKQVVNYVKSVTMIIHVLLYTNTCYINRSVWACMLTKWSSLGLVSTTGRCVDHRRLALCKMYKCKERDTHCTRRLIYSNSQCIKHMHAHITCICTYTLFVMKFTAATSLCTMGSVEVPLTNSTQ